MRKFRVNQFLVSQAFLWHAPQPGVDGELDVGRLKLFFRELDVGPDVILARMC